MDIGALSPTMVRWIMDRFERELLLEIHPFFPLNQDYRRKGTYMDAWFFYRVFIYNLVNNQQKWQQNILVQLCYDNKDIPNTESMWGQKPPHCFFFLCGEGWCDKLTPIGVLIYSTLPRFNMEPKIDGFQSRNFLFQGAIFRWTMLNFERVTPPWKESAWDLKIYRCFQK